MESHSLLKKFYIPIKQNKYFVLPEDGKTFCVE